MGTVGVGGPETGGETVEISRPPVRLCSPPRTLGGPGPGFVEGLGPLAARAVVRGVLRVLGDVVALLGVGATHLAP